MIETIYLERDVRDLPAARAALARYPSATVVPIERYGEVFNRNQQSFRLQKRRPSLILARKHGKLLMPAPYGVGGRHNFYFSHVLNCLYDCRYCFLQGMYRSAHYVLFANYEDFQSAIDASGRDIPDETLTFFSGYDGDSLVLEPLTGFVAAFLPFFATRPRFLLELRTKSVATRPLLEREPLENVVVAFSFTPEAIREKLEHGVPPVSDRIAAMKTLAERGFKVGLRFDPLVYHRGFREAYEELFTEIFGALPRESLHSVGLGAFRLPKPYYERMFRLYPEERLFAGPLEEREGMVSYDRDLEDELKHFCRTELGERVPTELLFEY